MADVAWASALFKQEWHNVFSIDTDIFTSVFYIVVLLLIGCFVLSYIYGKEPPDNTEVDAKGNRKNPNEWMMTTSIILAEIVVIIGILFCTFEFIILVNSSYQIG